MPGLEPGTPRLEVWCAIQLRHTGKVQYPVIETGAIDWKSIMLPLHQYCRLEDTGVDPVTSRKLSARSTD